jgi:hypothetical protein
MIVSFFIALINIIFSLNVSERAFAQQTNSVVFKIDSTEYLVNGKPNLMEVAPFIKNGRTYLPIRYVAGALGIASDNIAYSNGTVTIKKGDKLIRLFVNSQILVVDDKPVAMDASTVIIGGRTMLPIKWVAEAFNTSVIWNQAAKSVSISYVVLPSTTPKVKSMPKLTYSDLSNDEKLSESYIWKYGNITYDWNIEVPKSIYNYDVAIYSLADDFLDSDLAGKNRILKNTTDDDTKSMLLSLWSNGNYTSWVNDISNDAYIVDISKRLSDQASADGYDYLHTAEFVQNFVGGAIDYKIFEVPQLPAQTLIDNGDCKGKSILLASILKNMGYKVALLHFDPLPGSQIGHIAVGLALDGSNSPLNTSYVCHYYTFAGQNYYYTETTSPDFHIGEQGDLSDNAIDFDKASVYQIN